MKPTFFNMDKNVHPLAGTVVCKDNFFDDTLSILDLANSQEYAGDARWPGKRTINLLESTDPATKEFGIFFAKKIAREIFPGISRFVIHVSFHKNDVYNDAETNEGWIHSDDVNLAGLVYLTPSEQNFDSGTSIFLKKGSQDFSNADFPSRKAFNISGVATDAYKNDLKNNHNNFEETIRIGNVFNRIIGYDAKSWHRPNNFKTVSGEPRTSLLFFIDQYKYDRPEV
jgi:hypothetical protein